MIVIYVNSMEDTATFDAIYSNLSEDTIILHNPSRVDVDMTLIERPTETLLCFGHGSPMGLFSHDFKDTLIDADSVELLRDREMIGIWCYASLFGKTHNLRGFFTYMFISNQQECALNRCGWYENSVIFAENILFAERINTLIRENTPLEQWVEILYESRNADLPFVEFNYSNLTYLDGNENNTQLNEEDFGIMKQAESYLYDMFDDDDDDEDDTTVWEESLGKNN